VGSNEFKEQWSKVLYEAGAKVVTRLFSIQENSIDYILSDEKPADIVQEKALQLNQPLCSLEWFFQCVISQKVLDPNDHKDYVVKL